MLTELQCTPLEQRRDNARLHMLDEITGGKVAINIKDYAQQANTRAWTVSSVKLGHIGARKISYKYSFFREQKQSGIPPGCCDRRDWDKLLPI